MHCILLDEKDIYFNLATEEFLLKQRQGNFFMLWQSQACVVVGKHQNAMAEINHSFLRAKQIPVARRLTGGGTVYHDSGNLNFAFIMNSEKGKMVDFGRYITPVIEFLHSKNIPAQAGIKNDISINGLKISGNAEHVYKNRVLHHGTLLFNTDLAVLQQAIQIEPGKYIDKAVQSNRTEVVNISEFLNSGLSINTFKEDLNSFIKDYYADTIDYQFTKEEIKKILDLRNKKYSTWKWIFGYSPAFKIQRTIYADNQKIDLYLKVTNGVIEEALLNCESLAELEGDLSKKFIGERFEYNDIDALLSGEELISGDLKSSILKSIF